MTHNDQNDQEVSRNIRNTLLSYLRLFSDNEYQRRIWIEENYPPDGQFITLRSAIEYFFNDIEINNVPERGLGFYFKDQAEVNAIRAFSTRLKIMIDLIGLNVSDVSYVRYPLWNEVLQAAKNAVDLMDQNDRSSKERQ